jgi:hypothetical protein
MCGRDPTITVSLSGSRRLCEALVPCIWAALASQTGSAPHALFDQAQAGVRQTSVLLRLIQGQLPGCALLAFAQGHDAPPDGGHVLADRQVEALNERALDVLTRWGQKAVDASLRAEYHTMAPRIQPSASIFLDDLRIDSPWQGDPARLRGRACGLSARWLDPGPEVGQQRRGLLIDGFC